MVASAPVAFLFDADNTLLDNDRVVQRWVASIDERLGPGAGRRYRLAYEAVRTECDYADYLGAVQRAWVDDARDPRWLGVADFLLDLPFEQYVFPGALEALHRARALGPTWIVSDGDSVFQPRKLRRAGLWEAVRGNVMIFVHKEQALEEIERRCPAGRYVMVDDKLRILDAMKRDWGERLVTVFVEQGHYAEDAQERVGRRPADRTIRTIGAFPSLAGTLR